jgi:ATPase subunit of ABC transporter with duplicated ATPase domains
MLRRAPNKEVTMITTHGITVNFGIKPLFEDISIKFLPGNCYGLIGANGAGKSTFVKVLSGQLEATSGHVEIPGNMRMATLEQDQFKYDDYTVLETVFQGHPKLYAVSQERDALYAKADFSEEDGNRAAVLESEFADLNGYEAEAEAGSFLAGLGVPQDLHEKKMSEIEPGYKVRVLLAQAVFGSPDILLLDEPTNHLDVHTVRWLEDYLGRLDILVIVVSHDRRFLNNVCTHVADIDFRQIKIYVGNYDWWYQASELALQQRRDVQRKNSDKIKDLKAFIQRFSSNASKAKQATSRKKLLDKLTIDQLPISTRKYPHIAFQAERPCGRSVLRVEGLRKEIEGEVVLDDVTFMVHKGDRIAFLGPDARAKTTLFKILAGELEPDAGVVEWGQTITPGYLPSENEAYFKDVDLSLVDWLRQYSSDQHEQYVRGFLGRMLFSGDDTSKAAKVLSGGERVRCMLSKMMQVGANVLLLDEPTNHLDLESITALNNGLQAFEECVLLSSHDRELVGTTANRIMEFGPHGMIDRRLSFDEYVEHPDVIAEREKIYGGEAAL